MSALWNYGESESERRSIVKAGASEVIAAFLTCDNTNKARSACGLLWNLVELEDFKIQVFKNGLHRHTINLLKEEKLSTLPENRLSFLGSILVGTLQHLATHPDYRVDIIDRGGLACLVDVLKVTKWTTAKANYIQYRACLAVANLLTCDHTQCKNPQDAIDAHDALDAFVQRVGTDFKLFDNIQEEDKSHVYANVKSFLKIASSPVLAISRAGAMGAAILSTMERHKALIVKDNYVQTILNLSVSSDVCTRKFSYIALQYITIDILQKFATSLQWKSIFIVAKNKKDQKALTTFAVLEKLPLEIREKVKIISDMIEGSSPN
mmetsp:Transcript_10715/g.11777  ORF Transcript_10715/g.11777 Transcript_10715/m.11777 type:complete len:322 (+) Transcript_10715:327-1292(+)